jgi:hypothetical protein
MCAMEVWSNIGRRGLNRLFHLAFTMSKSGGPVGPALCILQQA